MSMVEMRLLEQGHDVIRLPRTGTSSCWTDKKVWRNSSAFTSVMDYLILLHSAGQVMFVSYNVGERSRTRILRARTNTLRGDSSRNVDDTFVLSIWTPTQMIGSDMKSPGALLSEPRCRDRRYGHPSRCSRASCETASKWPTVNDQKCCHRIMFA